MATSKPQPGFDIIVTTAVELVGVGLLALLAETSNDVGTIIVVFMVGILIIWLITHTAQLQKMPFFGGKI